MHRISPANYYDLADTIDACTDQDLIGLIQADGNEAAEEQLTS